MTEETKDYVLETLDKLAEDASLKDGDHIWDSALVSDFT